MEGDVVWIGAKSRNVKEGERRGGGRGEGGGGGGEGMSIHVSSG